MSGGDDAAPGAAVAGWSPTVNALRRSSSSYGTMKRERRVLQQRDQLADDGGHHAAEGLRHDDEPHRLPVRQADRRRPPRVWPRSSDRMPARKISASTARVVEREAGDHGPEAGQVDVRAGAGRRRRRRSAAAAGWPGRTRPSRRRASARPRCGPGGRGPAASRTARASAIDDGGQPRASSSSPLRAGTRRTAGSVNGSHFSAVELAAVARAGCTATTTNRDQERRRLTIEAIEHAAPAARARGRRRAIGRRHRLIASPPLEAPTTNPDGSVRSR